jgi:hypothetical protein
VTPPISEDFEGVCSKLQVGTVGGNAASIAAGGYQVTVAEATSWNSFLDFEDSYRKTAISADLTFWERGGGFTLDCERLISAGYGVAIQYVDPTSAVQVPSGNHFYAALYRLDGEGRGPLHEVDVAVGKPEHVELQCQRSGAKVMVRFKVDGKLVSTIIDRKPGRAAPFATALFAFSRGRSTPVNHFTLDNIRVTARK